MRNLKKFLALVLAMMMVFSLMITVNASTFTDKADIDDKYATSVDILQAIGVLKGYTNGSLLPQENVRRQEYAAILYRIHSGDTDDKDVAKYAQLAGNFDDVDVNDWYAGYIGYCYEKKLLKGTPGGSFGPLDYVKGTDVLVGMLRALGYDHNDELVGVGYEAAAQQTAYQVGITKTVRLASLMGNATRQQIAQLAYDTLITPTLIWNPIPTGGYQGNNDYYEKNGPTLGEKVFDLEVVPSKDAEGNDNKAFTDLKLEEDPFHRPTPSYVVMVKGKVVYEERGAVASYNGNFTGKDAKNLLKITGDITAAEVQGEGAHKGRIDVYYNGGTADNTTDIAFDGEHMWFSDTKGVPGYEVEIYAHNCDLTEEEKAENPCDVEFDIIVREAYLAQIVEVDSDNNTITVGIAESTSQEEIDVVKGDDIYKALSGFKEDDYLAVYMKPNWNNNLDDASYILAINELDKVSVEITRLSIGDYKMLSSVVSNKGTYAFTNESVIVIEDEPSFTGDAVENIKLSSATLYLHNGYILLLDQSTPTNTGYAYLYGVLGGGYDSTGSKGDDYWSDEKESTTSNTRPDPTAGVGDPTWVRMYLDTTGKMAQVQAVSGDYDVGGGSAAAPDNPGVIAEVFNSTRGSTNSSDGSDGALVYYEYNEATEVYTLYKISGVKQSGDSGDLEIKNDVAEGKIPDKDEGGSAVDVEFDDNTVFFVAVVGENGKLESCKVVTGIDKMASTTVSNGTYVAAAQATSPTDPTGTEATTADGTNPVTAVLIETQTGLVKGSYFIVVDENAPITKMKDAKGNELEIYTFNAVVNGTPTTVDVLKTTAEAFETDDGIVFVDTVWQYRTSGVIVDVEGTVTATRIKGITPVTSGNNITLTVPGDEGPDEDLPCRANKMRIYEYDVAEGTVKELDKSRITTNNAGDYVDGYAVMDGNNVLQLYITKTAAE